jgi:hypothetical protein
MNTTETKKCNKCGKILSIENFRLLKGGSKELYHLGQCKECEYKKQREYVERKRQVILRDNIEILIKREYKEIIPERILDLAKTKILPIGTDEIFVNKMDCKNFWISNYGRGISYSTKDNTYRLLNGDYDKYKLLRYSVSKNVYVNGKWVLKKSQLYAAQAVVEEFIVNPDTQNNAFIWHRGNDKEDNYYRNLYPLNRDQYYAVKKYYYDNNDDAEEIIVNIMNNIKYKPDDWSKECMKPIICGMGYSGRKEVDVKSRAYLRWHDMLSRAYNKKFHQSQPQYKGCSVCKEWLNFCNFEKWYNAHYYEIENNKMDLDKDILFKGNHFYSDSTCVIVPHKINTLFLNARRKRGNLPIGVHYDSEKNKYRAMINYDCDLTKLGRFNTPEEAFACYKKKKEELIQNVAERYKDRIPYSAYKAMMDWNVAIDD